MHRLVAMHAITLQQAVDSHKEIERYTEDITTEYRFEMNMMTIELRAHNQKLKILLRDLG